MDVAALYDDVMKWRNVVADSEYHASHCGKGHKEADRGDKQPAPRTVCNLLAHRHTQARAIEQPKQNRHQRQQNQKKSQLVGPGHGNLNHASVGGKGYYAPKGDANESAVMNLLHSSCV